MQIAKILEGLSAEERILLAQAIQVKLEAEKMAGMTKWERLRFQLDKARAANAGELPVPANLAEVVAGARKRAQERNDQARNGIPEPVLTVQAETPDFERCKAEWRELRKTNPNAGGDGVSILLGEPIQRKPAEIAPAEEEAIKSKRRPTKAEQKQIEAEAAFIEAKNEPDDFINRISGPGSNKPSGAFSSGRDGWMR